MENFITPLTVVDFTLDAEKVRNNLQKQGTPIGAHNIQIAAIALSLNMTLLTNNNEFERIKGVNFENWVG